MSQSPSYKMLSIGNQLLLEIWWIQKPRKIGLGTWIAINILWYAGVEFDLKFGTTDPNIYLVTYSMETGFDTS